jgi:hypothetical protein
MAFQLLPVDQQIASNCLLILLGKTGKGGKVDAAQGQAIVTGGGGANSQTIEFQFPPKVTSDSKSGEFETVKAAGLPPQAVFKSAGPRKISLRWEYVVTHSNNGWTVDRISANVRKIRGYFNLGFVQGQQDLTTENFIIYFKYGAFGKGNAQYEGFQAPCATFYCESVDVKHSDTLVYPFEDPDSIYPLKTEVSLTLIEWVNAAVNLKKNVAQNIKLLVTHPVEGWF